jgi:hypothetical protein
MVKARRKRYAYNMSEHRRLSRRQALLVAMSLPLDASSGKQRGAVAFHYAAAFSPRNLAWYTRFEILVTGAILGLEQSQRLSRTGTKLVAYEWTAGFYPGDDVSSPVSWQKQVESRSKDWLLTSTPIPGGAAEARKTAQWYDFGSAALLEERARMLAGRLAESAYHGFFFDTPGFEHLPPQAQAAFKQRHPDLDYNERVGLFLATLRRALPAGKIIFLNQGYRHAAHLLPHADMDLSESSFTYLDKGGTTRFRPWHDPAKPWESIRTPIYDLVMPAARKFPKVRMVHVNYAAGAPEQIRRAQRYANVCAAILGHQAYLIVPSAPDAEDDPIYFSDLGAPEDYWREEPSGVVWRRFQRGIAAINGCDRPAAVPSLGLSLPEPLQGYIFSIKG